MKSKNYYNSFEKARKVLNKPGDYIVNQDVR